MQREKKIDNNCKVERIYESVASCELTENSLDSYEKLKREKIMRNLFIHA